jgi:serine/threonine protein kinase
MGWIRKWFFARKLEHGKVRCDSCRRNVKFREFEPLGVGYCHKCTAPLFVPRKIHNYWLYKPLGAGGYGAVYKAIRLWNLQDVAVKLLKLGPRDDGAREKRIEDLRHEYEMGVALKGNRHIVAPVEFGQEGEDVFLVTEFVEGVRLDVIIRLIGQIPEEIAYRLILQVVDIEQFIYDHGFLYRDMKPENILVNPKGDIKLMDYGLCLDIKEAEHINLTRDTIEGSPFYLPPERIAGMAEDQPSEIYSMGMLLYNMLTGKTFYKANTTGVQGLMRKHMSSERLISALPQLHNCHPSTRLLINRMITRETEERFQNFQALKKSLVSSFKKVRQQKGHRKISFREFLKSIE